MSEEVERGAEDSAREGARAPLALVKGDATPEEVAALVTVLQAVAASRAAAAETRRPTSEWAAHHRGLRATFPAGPGGWRSSGMPR